MDFRRLQYFVAVAEERHYGRAAGRLQVAQPAVSQQISRLESELQFKLFERGHHSVTLTEAGRSLLADARRILALVDDATSRAAAASQGLNGGLTIGFVGSMHFSLPATIAKLLKQYPEVRVRLNEMTFDQLLSALYEERIDLGLFRQWPLRISMPVEEISTTAMAVVLPRNHRLLKRSAVPLVEIANESFIYLSGTMMPGYAERINAAFAEIGVVPRVVQEVFSTQVALSFVASGSGVGITPPFAAGSMAMEYGIECRPLIEPQITVPTVAAWRQGTQSQVRTIIIKALREGMRTQ